MSSDLVRGGEPSSAAPIGSVDETPVKYLHLRESSSIPSLLCGADSFTITRLESSSGLAEPITKLSTVPALLVAVSIPSLPRADYQCRVDEKRVPTPNISPFNSSVIDLDAQLGCWVRRAFDYVLFRVPRKGLDDIAADLAVRPVGTYKLSRHQEDLVLTQLTKSILPYIGRPGWPCPLALDHLSLILRAHLLQQYAGLRKSLSVGGLGPSQKRRATELLSEDLSGRIRLSELAAECGLSIGHFARSFKASFGVSAHRWLMQRRIERSQELLIHTRESLSDIAEQAGFSDQAAFTRTFHQIVGVSPGRWRRDYKRS
jgi:AraC family transcriptional regulator